MIINIFKLQSQIRLNFNDFCSGELLGQKVMIPCDPVAHLNQEYGKDNWITPLSKNYIWKNMIWEEKKNWTDSEWPNIVRYYYRNGSLNKNQTLTFLNNHLAVKLESLPPQDGSN